MSSLPTPSSALVAKHPLIPRASTRSAGAVRTVIVGVPGSLSVSSTSVGASARRRGLGIAIRARVRARARAPGRIGREHAVSARRARRRRITAGSVVSTPLGIVVERHAAGRFPTLEDLDATPRRVEGRSANLFAVAVRIGHAFMHARPFERTLRRMLDLWGSDVVACERAAAVAVAPERAEREPDQRVAPSGPKPPLPRLQRGHARTINPSGVGVLPRDFSRRS